MKREEDVLKLANNSLQEINFDLLYMILQNLPFKDLFSFLSVNKIYRNFIIKKLIAPDLSEYEFSNNLNQLLYHRLSLPNINCPDTGRIPRSLAKIFLQEPVQKFFRGYKQLIDNEEYSKAAELLQRNNFLEHLQSVMGLVSDNLANAGLCVLQQDGLRLVEPLQGTIDTVNERHNDILKQTFSELFRYIQCGFSLNALQSIRLMTESDKYDHDQILLEIERDNISPDQVMELGFNKDRIDIFIKFKYNVSNQYDLLRILKKDANNRSFYSKYVLKAYNNGWSVDLIIKFIEKFGSYKLEYISEIIFSAQSNNDVINQLSHRQCELVNALIENASQEIMDEKFLLKAFVLGNVSVEDLQILKKESIKNPLNVKELFKACAIGFPAIKIAEISEKESRARTASCLPGISLSGLICKHFYSKKQETVGSEAQCLDKTEIDQYLCFVDELIENCSISILINHNDVIDLYFTGDFSVKDLKVIESLNIINSRSFFYLLKTGLNKESLFKFLAKGLCVNGFVLQNLLENLNCETIDIKKQFSEYLLNTFTPDILTNYIIINYINNIRVQKIEDFSMLDVVKELMGVFTPHMLQDENTVKFFLEGKLTVEIINKIKENSNMQCVHMPYVVHMIQHGIPLDLIIEGFTTFNHGSFDSVAAILVAKSRDISIDYNSVQITSFNQISEIEILEIERFIKFSKKHNVQSYEFVSILSEGISLEDMYQYEITTAAVAKLVKSGVPIDKAKNIPPFTGCFLSRLSSRESVMEYMNSSYSLYHFMLNMDAGISKEVLADLTHIQAEALAKGVPFKIVKSDRFGGVESLKNILQTMLGQTPVQAGEYMQILISEIDAEAEASAVVSPKSVKLKCSG